MPMWHTIETGAQHSCTPVAFVYAYAESAEAFWGIKTPNQLVPYVYLVHRPVSSFFA